MKMIFTKADIGKKIYAKPTGNKARNWNGHLEEFKVIKIKSRYVELEYENGQTDNFDKEDGVTQRDVNSGWMNSGYEFYATLEDYANEQTRLNCISNIQSNVYMLKKKATLEEVQQIEDILSKILERA